MLLATRFKIDTKSIFNAIPSDAVVVEIHTSRGGLVVLGITTQGIKAIHQAPISDIKLRRLIFPYIKAYRKSNETVIDKQLLHNLQEISKMIVDPIKDLINKKDHIIFVPSSIFMAFPFCCLLFKRRSLVLEKAVSQVPSLAILQRLVQRSMKKIKAKGLSAIVNSHDQGRNPVPMVGVGSFTISRLFKTMPVVAEKLDETSFAEKYQKSLIVHIATHGVQSALSPWQSYLSLKERFRVMELAKLTTEAALVVFSACLSGLGRSTSGNDLLGFSHAVLQSGAQVYIGALWQVSDWATMLLMLLFYRKLAEREPGLSIAKAWQHAQKSFYNLTTETAVSFLQEIAGVWDVAEKEGLNPRQFSRMGRDQVEFLMEDLGDEDDPVDFKDPYYWAPFVLVGNANLCLSKFSL